MEKAEKDTYDLPEGNATHHVCILSLPSLPLHDHVQRRARRVIYATAARSSRRRREAAPVRLKVAASSPPSLPPSAAPHSPP